MKHYITPLGYELTPKEMDLLRDELKNLSMAIGDFQFIHYSTNELLNFVDIFKTLTNTGK
jgi:hypothetical protein